MSWVRVPPVRASFLTLVAAVALACAGVVAITFQPSVASAGVTPGIKPDFELSQGDVVPESYPTTLIGSAEVKSNPDDCRNNPALGLTCAAHRLKVHRSADPDVQLRIVLEWDGGPVSDTLSVPDVDLFLFDGPTSKFDSTKYGGAGQTVPEQIAVTPTQDEYDIVVQAYAGAIRGYKLTVSYTKTATLKPGSVTPDIVLAPHKTFTHSYDTVLVGQPALSVYPDGCRNQAEYDFVCDVYRIKLNRNLTKGALNFVVVTLYWDPVATIPGLPAVATATVERPVPDLNMYVYDAPQHALPGVGGTHIDAVPERVGWTATQDEYDLVVQSSAGQGLQYKLTAFMSDELFDKPFELLDPLTGQQLIQQPDGSLVPAGPGDSPLTPTIPQLSLAPIDDDAQISGIGLGATEQFDADALRLGADALRNTSTVAKPPPDGLLWVSLVFVPGALLGIFLVLMRRRHQQVF